MFQNPTNKPEQIFSKNQIQEKKLKYIPLKKSRGKN